MMSRLVKFILYTGISVLAILVALLVFFWAPDKSVAELGQWLLPDSEFVEVEGMQVHVVQSNLCQDPNNKTLSEVVVLLHGTSASLHTWEGWATELSDESCVIRMDLPGFGLTGPYVNESIDYTSDNYAAFVTQVMDRLQVSQATLVGNSLGGKIAWRTAALYPEYVEKLILIDSVGYPATPKEVPLAFKIAKYPALAPILNYVLPRDVVRKSLVSVYADDSKVNDALIDRYYDLALRQGNRQALIDRLQEFDSTENQDQIKSLTLPTLVLWGAQDDLIPVENAKRFHQDISNSQLKIFDDLGHVPHEEDPIATVKAARQFLAGESLID